MSVSKSSTMRCARARARLEASRFARDTSGVAALEFGILATPFFLLLLGVISVGMYYFQVSTIETAALQAARAIRTGQLQQGQGAYTGLTTDADKKAAFRSAFCKYAVAVPDCLTKSAVIVQSSTQFTSLSTPNCTSGGNIVSNASTTFSPGSTSSVVMVTVCYPWAPVAGLPFGKLGTLSDGSFLVQATVAFRTEPY